MYGSSISYYMQKQTPQIFKLNVFVPKAYMPNTLLDDSTALDCFERKKLSFLWQPTLKIVTLKTPHISESIFLICGDNTA